MDVQMSQKGCPKVPWALKNKEHTTRQHANVSTAF